MPRPLPIRYSLLVNLILVIVLLSGATLATTFVGGRTQLEHVSATLTTEMLDRAEQRLEQFFEPVQRGLVVAGDWGRAGLLDLDDPERLRRLFEPIVARLRQVSSILIADGDGREFMLLRTPEYWGIRLTHPQEWGTRSRWMEWSDGNPVTSWRDLNYDPRKRPWYQGAVRRRDALREVDADPRAAAGIHWTRPYSFFTTGEPGITAALVYDDRGETDRVVGFDVLLRDIADYTVSLQPSRHGKVFVVTEDGRVVGLPNDPRFADPERRREALLKEPAALGLKEAMAAQQAFQRYPPDYDGPRIPNVVDEPLRFLSESQPWWGQLRQFPLSVERRLWIAVVVPESQLLGELTRFRLSIVAAALIVLGVAILLAFRLARRYSEPIEALVQQSDRISGGDLEPGPPVRSGVSEVQQLARAHERMRVGLQSLLELEREIQVARDIQQRTFPRTLPRLPGFEIDAWSEPAEQTGGDSYDVVGFTSTTIIDDRGTDADRAMLMMADATGHGVGPALSVTQVRSMLRMAGRLNAELGEIVQHVNRQLSDDLPPGRFITLWLAELNAMQSTLRMFSVGQGPIVIYHAARDELEILRADTVPLGILEDLPLGNGEPRLLRPGDIVAIVSDGIFEAANPENEQFGVQRVADIIREHRHRTAGGILGVLRERVTAFRKGRPADDDQTALFVKRSGSPD